MERERHEERDGRERERRAPDLERLEASREREERIARLDASEVGVELAGELRQRPSARTSEREEEACERVRGDGRRAAAEQRIRGAAVAVDGRVDRRHDRARDPDGAGQRARDAGRAD